MIMIIVRNKSENTYYTVKGRINDGIGFLSKLLTSTVRTMNLLER
jgi:hypothetical protein